MREKTVYALRILWMIVASILKILGSVDGNLLWLLCRNILKNVAFSPIFHSVHGSSKVVIFSFNFDDRKTAFFLLFISNIKIRAWYFTTFYFTTLS